MPTPTRVGVCIIYVHNYLMHFGTIEENCNRSRVKISTIRNLQSFGVTAEFRLGTMNQHGSNDRGIFFTSGSNNRLPLNRILALQFRKVCAR